MVQASYHSLSKMNIVSNMLESILTIKANAVEDNSIKKITDERSAQRKYICMEKFMFSLTFTVLGNAGFIGIFIVLIFQWST